MSSPSKSIDEGEDVSLEGDDSLIPPSRDPDSPPSNGNKSPRLSDTHETDVSDDEQTTPISPEVQKRDASLISDEKSDSDVEVSPSKKAKKVVSSGRREDSASLESRSENDPIGDLTLKKAEKDTTMPADSTLAFPPNPKGSSSAPTQAFHLPEKKTGKIKDANLTPVLRALLGMSPPPISPISPIGEATTSSAPPKVPMGQSEAGRLLASLSTGSSTQSRDGSLAPTQPSTLLDILLKPPIISSNVLADTDAPNTSNPSGGNRPPASGGQEESSLLRALLDTKQSPADTKGAAVSSIPAQISEDPSIFEPLSEFLLLEARKHIADQQNSEETAGYFEDISSEESCSPSSPNVSPEQKTKPAEKRDGKSSGAEHDTEGLHGSISPSQSSCASSELQAESSNVASKDVQVAEGNLSSQLPPSSPSSASHEPGVIEQLSAQLSNTSSEPARDTDDGNASGQAKGPESKLISSQQSAFASESSMDIDETSHSSFSSSNNTPSAPDSVFSGSSEEALRTESSISSRPTSSRNISPESSEIPMNDDLESIKSEDSSKMNTPGRKSKRLQEAKKSSEGKTASSAPEVKKVVDPEDKEPVNPMRLHAMKSRLGDLSLGGSSVTNSPTRRSARIQSKEGGTSSKESISLEKEKEGKNLQSKPVGRVASGERTKAGEKSKSLSRERIAKLKAASGASRGESGERVKDGKTSQSRSRDGTPSGSRERTPSEVNVASRTRSNKSRMASSNSEADKTEEDENETVRVARKSRKDSSK